MKKPTIHHRRCTECQADNEPSAEQCWLCGAKLGREADVVQAELVETPGLGASETFFALLTNAAAALTLLLVVGAFASGDRGIAVLVGVVTVPALAATILRTLGRRARGLPFSWQKTFLTFLLTVAAVISIGAVLIVALVVALFVMCLRMLNAM